MILKNREEWAACAISDGIVKVSKSNLKSLLGFENFMVAQGSRQACTTTNKGCIFNYISANE